MTSLKQRTDGSWFAYYRDANGKRRQLAARSRDALQDRVDALRLERDEAIAAGDWSEALAAAGVNDTANSNPVTDEDWERLFWATVEKQKAEDDTDADVTDVTWRWGDKPVGLLLWSDWHIGSRWTNLERLHDDIRDVREFRETYRGALHLAHLGDLKDNYTSTTLPSGLHESSISRTDKQEGVALWLAKGVGPGPKPGTGEDGGQFDGMLLGCHPAWDLTKQGRDSLAPIAAKLGAVNGGYGLAAEIHVGDQTYNVVMRHKSKGGQALNPGNSERRMDDDYGPHGERYDAICTSHVHTSYLQVTGKAGRQVVYTHSGAYKGGDCFARGGAFTHTKAAECGVPLLIFLPGEKRIIPFGGHHWREGLRMLAMLRGEG